MEHADRKPTAFATNAVRVLPRAIASGLLVLSLLMGLLGALPHGRPDLVEISMSREATTPRTDCGTHAKGGSAYCPQSGVSFPSEGGAVEGRAPEAGRGYSLSDAAGRLQHRPGGPLRPPTTSSPVA